MIHGVINIYKEEGFTSHDVVAKLRGILRQKKIGHTGTLDPAAVGVLPVCLGKGTKLCDMLTDKRKTLQNFHSAVSVSLFLPLFHGCIFIEQIGPQISAGIANGKSFFFELDTEYLVHIISAFLDPFPGPGILCSDFLTQRFIRNGNTVFCAGT